MKIIGLTGSIATGKSFIANLFKQVNVPVFSADQQVSLLLNQENIIKEISDKFDLKKAIINGIIDKKILADIVFKESCNLKKLEEIIYPHLKIKRKEFIDIHQAQKVILFEIPLLYEKKLDNICDFVVVTYCHSEIQLARAMRRINLTKEKFEFILTKQISCEEKIARADFVINTGISYSFSELQAKQIIEKITK